VVWQVQTTNRRLALLRRPVVTVWTPGKIHKPIAAGERHFSHNELKNASDFTKFHPAACIYRQGTPATVKCKNS
jgi:hypothetical protein